MSYRIVPVREDQLERVGELTAQVYVGEGYIPDTADYVNELRDARLRAAEAEVWVADEEGEILGAVAFCPDGSPYQELAQEREAEFRMLVVNPSARGRGVGEALVRQCISRARELGYAGLVLSTMPGMDDARRVYERLGFVRIPERDWSPVPDVELLGFRLTLE